MPRLVWTDNALRDLSRLHSFLAEKRAGSASRAVTTIRLGLRVLAKDPAIGRPVEGKLPEYREWVIHFGRRAYVALYFYDGHEVIVLAVRHGREDGY